MTQEYSAKWWAVFICITFIEVVLLIMLVTRQASGIVVVAIVVTAFLLFLLPRLDDVIAMTLDKGRLESKINSVSKKTNTAKSRIDKLISLLMADSMYDNLKKLSAGNFGHYEMSERLEREFYHLRSLGYIELMDMERIRDIPYEGNNLSEYVKITSCGKQFIELRDSVAKDNSSN